MAGEEGLSMSSLVLILAIVLKKKRRFVQRMQFMSRLRCSGLSLSRVTHKAYELGTVEPRYNEPRYNVVYIPLFSLVQLGYPAITNIFVVNQIICYNGIFAITKTPL